MLVLPLATTEYRTHLVTIQGEKIEQKLFEGERFQQGVFSDDTTIYFTRRITVVRSLLASCNSNFDNFRYYYEKAPWNGVWATQITAVNGAVVAVEYLKRWLVKLPQDSTYFGFSGTPVNWGPCEAFVVMDTVVHISYDQARPYPFYDEYPPGYHFGGRPNAWMNVTVDGSEVRWIDKSGNLLSVNIEHGGHTIERVVLYQGPLINGCAGRHGCLFTEAASSIGDTAFFRYVYYGGDTVLRCPIIVPKLEYNGVRVITGWSGGWSQGYFYIAVIEDTNKVGVYRIKEPEPPVSVEEEPTEVAAEIDAPQKLSMTREEFVEWRKHRAAQTTYTDVNGKRLDATAVVRSGVVMVREGAKVFVVLVE
ncbi:MAG: hypothetical protein HQ472_09835 [Ignavibacteria bacterium]|nr:hypothetical protein [Ignavibacteria bacterium]